VGKGDPMGDLYPPVYMGDPMGLFLCCGYEYGVVIPGGYLPIAISTRSSYGHNSGWCSGARVSGGCWGRQCKVRPHYFGVGSGFQT
jgi:hypothetical protein